MSTQRHDTRQLQPAGPVVGRSADRSSVGDEGPSTGGPGRARRTTERDAHAASLAERLGDYLDTRVRIDVGRAKSRITIECASREDVERVLARIDGSLAAEAG